MFHPLILQFLNALFAVDVSGAKTGQKLMNSDRDTHLYSSSVPVQMCLSVNWKYLISEILIKGISCNFQRKNLKCI